MMYSHVCDIQILMILLS